VRRRLPSGDDGNAILEFVMVAVVLMVPLVYVMLTVFELQRASFAVSAAAREAGRAYVTADSGATAPERAQTAADLALADQLPGSPVADVTVVDGGAGLDPGESVTVSVRYEVTLPLLGSLATIPVTGKHVATVDRYRAPA
jgi:Flp pilus assembly protein TadG